MKPLDQMTEADVIAALGPPDKITRGRRMMAIEWKCSTCVEITKSATAIPVPAPCHRCGGIAFEKIH